MPVRNEVSGMTSKINQWKVIFITTPKVVVSKVLNLPNVTLVTESDERNTSITSIEITTPDLSFVDAINYSQLMANRCADILSFISGYGVVCSLKQINEIGGDIGTPKMGAVMFTADALFVKPTEVNLTRPAFLGVIKEKDEKLARQLSHLRRGISSSDLIEQIREFYQIIEDEYGENDHRTEQYKYVRHLVNHAELTRAKSKEEAIRILGKPYLDPSQPSDISVLSHHLASLKKDAFDIIIAKT